MSTLPIPVQMITDASLFVIVCLPLVLFQTLGKPIETGFWCNDQSLGYPYKPDTIPQSLLLTISFGVPFLVIAVTESIRAAVNLQLSTKFKSEMMNLAKAYSVFLFGMTINCIFTDAAKYSSGRPRPHFFDVCKPDFAKINCTTDTGLARHAAPIRLFWRKHINIISLMQFVVCIFFLLLIKLLEISVRDLFEEDAILKLIGAKSWSLSKSENPVTIYASDDNTNSLLDTRDMCGDMSGYDALVIVHTAVAHFEHRQRYRDTYGNFDFTRPYRLKIVFFLGLPSDPSLQSEILRENTQDGDTVQGNFTDTYRNLTYKAVMAYRWVSQNCRHVKVILKMDDDVIFDVHRFFDEFVLPPIYQQELIFCHIWTLAEVERIGKWGISLQDYRGDYYPPYCSGFIVVVMPAIVEDLYETARDTPFLWLDDVFIYGVVRQEMRDVQLINLDEVAFREEHYKACYKQYGYRCKYWATVLPEGQEFISTLMSLRAERLRFWGPEKQKTDNHTVMLFVTQYECTNTHIEQKWLHDSILSFPSGHASVSIYSATFTIFYLQVRMNVRFSYLLKPALQACALMLALYCCISRVTDHKHFSTDVIAGSVIGAFLAWAAFYRVACRVLCDAVKEQSPPRLPRAVSVESEPRTPTPLLRPERIVIDPGYKNSVAVTDSRGSFSHKVLSI